MILSANLINNIVNLISNIRREPPAIRSDRRQFHVLRYIIRAIRFKKGKHTYMTRLIKLNSSYLAVALSLAVALILSPLALRAQSTRSTGRPDVYLGVIGGVAAGNYNIHVDDGSGDTGDFNSSLAGGRVGVQGGIDFNVEGLVLGAVADWSWADARMKFDESSAGTSGSFLDGKVKQMTTVRARVGKRFHRLMPYVQGGLLVADTSIGSDEGLFANGKSSESKVHSGFVVGGGIEYALAHHYTFSTEYGYNHVSGVDFSDVLGTSGGVVTANPHFSTLTVGFDYHF